MDARYRSMNIRPEYIFIPTRNQTDFNEQFLDELNVSIKKFNVGIIVQPLRELYQFYEYSDLIRHPAIIYLPYQVSTMSIFEQYSMNIPLFFPSIDLLTTWHLEYYVIYDRTWDRALTGVGKSHSIIPRYDSNSTVPDPNNEHDYASIHYWLKYADFYQWPYITYFNSFDDLALKLSRTNLTLISENMSKYNKVKKLKVLKHWRTILTRLTA